MVMRDSKKALGQLTEVLAGVQVGQELTDEQRWQLLKALKNFNDANAAAAAGFRAAGLDVDVPRSPLPGREHFLVEDPGITVADERDTSA